MSGRGRTAPVSPFLDGTVKQFDEIRTSIGGKVAAIDSALANHFPFNSLSQAAAAFKGSVATNPQLGAALDVVRDVLSQAVRDIMRVELWLTLKVPQAEDGNNFGVIILHEVHKAVTEHRTSLTTRLDALPDYYSARSGAVEKISTKVSTDVKESSSKAQTTGGKDGPEDKTTVSKSEEKSTKAQEPLPDQVEHITAIDVKWYNILREDLELARFSYIVVEDVLNKNYDKLNAPKGDKSSGSHLSMF